MGRRAPAGDGRANVRLRRGRADALPGAAPLERRRDELAEERRGPRRARLELGMELARDEPGMVGQLDDLDEAALLERPRHHEPVLDELLAVLVVDLVAVAMALVDDVVVVDVPRAGALGELDRLGAEQHRPAQLL